ncbi:MAG: cbb3-type cytochrome oxidase assembly protein CcoS [Azospira sp.]|jgi:cbb3-type cytochrome oxidase maturation protein|nr:cbb3-type cytochrome oxidase assembly protein CcoS [Azospira sp.]
MESLYLLIPLSVVLVFVIAAAFWWSVKSGQFDDMEGPAYRILMDEDRRRVPGGDVAAQQKGAGSSAKEDDERAPVK